MSNAFLKYTDLLVEKYTKEDFKVDTSAQENDTDSWTLVDGGNKVPFVTRDGKKFLLVWNPKLRCQGYLDVEEDVIISDDEFNKGSKE